MDSFLCHLALLFACYVLTIWAQTTMDMGNMPGMSTTPPALITGAPTTNAPPAATTGATPGKF
jgi:hypothetical protein